MQDHASKNDKQTTDNSIDPSLEGQNAPAGGAPEQGMEQGDGWQSSSYPAGAQQATPSYPLSVENGQQDGTQYDPRSAPAYPADQQQMQYPPGGAPWPYIPPMPYYPSQHNGPPPQMMQPPYPYMYPPPLPGQSRSFGSQDSGEGSADPAAAAPQGGTGKPKVVGRKLWQACEMCRIRKNKCDGIRPECGTCARMGRPNCTYNPVRRRRGPGKANKGSKYNEFTQPRSPAKPKPTAEPKPTVEARPLVDSLTNGYNPLLSYIPVPVATTTSILGVPVSQVDMQRLEYALRGQAPPTGKAEPAPSAPPVPEVPAKSTQDEAPLSSTRRSTRIAISKTTSQPEPEPTATPVKRGKKKAADAEGDKPAVAAETPTRKRTRKGN